MLVNSSGGTLLHLFQEIGYISFAFSYILSNFEKILHRDESLNATLWLNFSKVL